MEQIFAIGFLSLLCIILSLIIIYLIFHSRKTTRRFQILLEMEKKEKNQIEELLEMTHKEMAELQKNIQSNEPESPLVTATNDNDQNFLNHISSILEKNLDNPDFVIDEFARELGVSRTVFYSKFKTLTGMTPNDYVMNFKMKRATYLLQNHPELQITDITYQLGFCSPRYFSRCFKMQFNITPTEFRKQLAAH